MSLEDRFRQALDDAIAEVRTRLESQFTATLTDVRAEADRDKAEALAALEAAKAAELLAVDEAKVVALADLEAAKVAELAAAVAAADEAKTAALADVRGSLESELMQAFQSEKDMLVSSHATLLSQLREAADGDLTQLRDTAAADVERLRGEAEASATLLREEADAALASAHTQLQQAQAEVARLREEFEAARTQSTHDATVEVEKAKADVEAELVRVRGDHETALSTVRAEAQDAAAAFSQAIEAQLTGAIRLLEAVRALDGATSLTEVLDALTCSAAKEAGRAAILVLKGDRLLGWRTTGFGMLDSEPRSIESSTADGSALAAAVNTGRPALVGSGSVLAAPAFSQLPADRAGLAVPLLVAGRPVAVLYADTGTATPASSAWTSPVEVLVRHAGRCLGAMAVSRGAHARAAATRVGTPA